MSILTEKPEYFTPGATEEKVRLVPLDPGEQKKLRDEFTKMARRIEDDARLGERIDAFTHAAKELQQANGYSLTKLVETLATAGGINLREWHAAEITRLLLNAEMES